MRRLLTFSVLLLLLTGNAFADEAAVRVDAQVYPAHGLPALPLILRITLVNDGQKPAQFTKPLFCLEITDPERTVFPCDAKSYADFGQLPFGRREQTSPFTVDARASRVFFMDTADIQMLIGPRTLKPGKYTLRVRFQFSEAPSAPIGYTVDDPQGDNRAVWQRMMEVAASDDPENIVFEVDDRMQAVYAAHPKSDYAKLARLMNETMTRTPGLGHAVEIEKTQSAIEAGLPELYVDYFRLGIANEYEAWAYELARDGKFDDAAEKAAMATEILRNVMASRDPYAAANARAIYDAGSWTKADLKKAFEPAPAKASHARVDCVAINNDGTFTAWFGYENPNKGFYDVPLGPDNHFEPAPENRGQPHYLNAVGTKEHVFSVTAPVGEKLVWVLEGTRATASANEGIRHCEDSPAQGH